MFKFARVIEKIILYAYVGEIDITTHTVLDLLTLGKLLGERFIEESCISFIAKR